IDLTNNNELSQKFASIIERIASAPQAHHDERLCLSLIPALAIVPIRTALSAIAYLDNAIAERSGTNGWGVSLFLRAHYIYENAPDNDAYLYAKVLCERILVILKSRLYAEMFS
ncbi:MAG: hypothetical protein CUN55_20735, partial [Phototrophicales bacterium]